MYIFVHITDLSPVFFTNRPRKGTQKVRRLKSIQFIKHICIDSTVLIQREYDENKRKLGLPLKQRYIANVGNTFSKSL